MCPGWLGRELMQDQLDYMDCIAVGQWFVPYQLYFNNFNEMLIGQ